MLLKNHKIINNIDELKSHVINDKKNQSKIVFTNGCFDVIHSGHIHILESAKSKGDKLIVGLNSDKSVSKIKPGRPINSQNDRAYVLSGISYVDYIYIFDENTPQKLIEEISPDILIKGKDYKGKMIVGEDFMLKNNKQVELIELVPEMSTSQIINKIKKSI